MKTQMKNLRALTYVLIIGIHYISHIEYVGSMPKKVKGSSSKVSVSSQLLFSNSVQRDTSRVKSNSKISHPSQTDSELPSTSSLLSSSSKIEKMQSSASSVLVSESGTSYSSIRVKQNDLHLNNGSLSEGLSNLNLSEKSGKESSTSSSSSVLEQEAISVSVRMRRYARPETILPGEAILRNTFDKGIEVEGGGIRPHLVISVERSVKYGAGHTAVLVADMSTLQGKEYKLDSRNNYLINPDTPGFGGRFISFVKLDKVRWLVLKNSKKERL